MKIAVIADIHGNLPALESVMADIKKRSVDRIICLGDIIGKGPSSKEAVDICRKECDVIVIGNWESVVYEYYSTLKQGNSEGLNERTRRLIYDVGSERMEYLGALPHSTEFYLSGKLVRLFHAHPRNFNRYFADSPVEQRLELFDYNEHSAYQKESDVAVYADIHTAYMQLLHGKRLINTGSVGNPLDMTEASYVILEGEESGDSSLAVQLIRVPYDIEKAVEIAVKADIPDLEGYLSELRTATYFRRG